MPETLTADNLIELAAKAPQPREQGRALNAYRHGLTGQVRITTPEDQKAFRAHCDAYLEDRKPKGKLEMDTTLDVALLRWRMNMCDQIAETMMNMTGSVPKNIETDNPQIEAALERAWAWIQHDKSFNLLGLYERRIRSSYDKALAQLDAMQEKRKRQEREAAIAARHAAKAARDLALVKESFERDMQPLGKPKSDFVFSASKSDRSD